MLQIGSTFKEISAPVPDTFTMVPCPIPHLSFFFASDCIGCSGFREVSSCYSKAILEVGMKGWAL